MNPRQNQQNEAWIARVRQPVQEGLLLSAHTTWRIGGPARWLLQPTTPVELQQLLLSWPTGLPRLLLGGGSNLLVDDNGFDGVVLDLTRHMNRITLLPAASAEEDGVLLQAEAGAGTRALAHFARSHGLTGLEFLGGIPGSVGGALRMNAGAYGGEVRDGLLECTLLDGEGNPHTLPLQQLGMGYRSTRIPPDWIFLSGRFRLQRGDPDAIRERMRHLNRQRRQSQPLAFPSAGSTFKNPPEGPKAWQWIEAAGLRGAWSGQAQVSEKHCNFLVNRGGASSRDVRLLIDRIRERVCQAGGGVLALEIGIVAPSGLVADDAPNNHLSSHFQAS
ncbi:MAG: UDP-N-acetylmuramate dehydrogenase [Magnetococcales bacterium]|nr:UDP-N-acetylmuramate dehydrogenase [Magnetococcales bacterium]